MFLDEKLEEIYNSTELGSIDQSNKLIRALSDSLNINCEGVTSNWLLTGLFCAKNNSLLYIS